MILPVFLHFPHRFISVTDCDFKESIKVSFYVKSYLKIEPVLRIFYKFIIKPILKYLLMKVSIDERYIEIEISMKSLIQL